VKREALLAFGEEHCLLGSSDKRALELGFHFFPRKHDEKNAQRPEGGCTSEGSEDEGEI
jgi:hypothetical protein